MLALRSRCPPTSVPFRQTRSLRSTPRELPAYIKRWNPTLYKPRDPQPSIGADKLWSVSTDDTSRAEERRALRDSKRFSISFAGFSQGQHATVENLVRLLRKARGSNSHDSKMSQQLWGAYRIAKKLNPDLPSRIPKKAWDILWSTQQANPLSRNEYMTVLEHDLRSAGITTAGQRAHQLEQLFVEGKEQEALEGWESDHGQSIQNLRHDYRPEHLESGTKLHALAGNTQKAKQIMDELYRLYPDWSPSVMMLVFRAHTSSGSEKNHDTAREIYLEIKERMGTNISIETYDACLVGFLEARSLRHAKQVFRDMCKDGHLVPQGDAINVGAVLKRLHMLYQLGTDISKMTSIALDAISALPTSYHSHVFGNWMKCSVVENAPEAAAQILDMMFQRGCEPEAYHFNLLLRALLRTKETSKVLQAENIGWRMVEKAGDTSITADRIPGGPTLHIWGNLGDETLANERHYHNEDPEVIDITAVPGASGSTFGILMQHHAKVSQWEHVDYLARKLKEAGISPNTTIMNVLIDSKNRQGRFSEAWMIYKSLADNPDALNIFPTGETFRLLWKTLRFALGEQVQSASQESHLPKPRALLAETVRWCEMCRSRYDAERFRQGLAAADHGAIMGLMMHCFSYTQDLPGCLVALHYLRRRFDVFPSDKALDILIRQIAWVDMRNEPESVRSQSGHNRINQLKKDSAKGLFQHLLAHRLKKMNIGSGDELNLNDEKRGDLGLSLLSEFVRVEMKKTLTPLEVEAAIDSAKAEVGVPDLSTGDMDAI